MGKKTVRLCWIWLSMIIVVGIIGSKVYAQEQKKWTGNVNVFLGAAILNKQDWGHYKNQYGPGLEFDFKHSSWPASLALDILYSWGQEGGWGIWYFSKTDFGETAEVDPGVRKIWEGLPRVRPFIGGGPAIVKATQGTSHFIIAGGDTDVGLGWWLQGGTFFKLNKPFNLGLEVRYSRAQVELFDRSLNAGAWRFGMLIGFHFS